MTTSTRTTERTQADAREVALAVRAYVAMVRTQGSVWSSDPETAVLRRLRGKRAWQLFGESGITAAASRNVPACCTFGYARLLALKLDESAPRVNPATITLLGPPCSSCVSEIAAETEAATPTDGAAGRRVRSSRPAASSNVLIASAESVARRDGPQSPDGWTIRPLRQPSEADDRAFLADMAKQDAARRRRR
jgi:hypothetical protein